RPPTCPILSTRPPPPTSTLFPYTTLFRSQGRRPSANKIVNALQAYLSELDPDLLTEQLKAGGLDSLPTWKYKDDNVSLEIEPVRSEEHTSELQSRSDLVCRLLLEKKK